ncbi:hypothetical protein GCM10018785_01780 [Streptomyces longispororuber]|uniref:Uncharacterized protein n=1 Tax=Streptomyces longispororuber TaxID=68230 RepID=A0A918Z4K4_9ACTN|nr:hypothetical protein GCM10018785_01780 [Streptomyces longispororuber]
MRLTQQGAPTADSPNTEPVLTCRPGAPAPWAAPGAGFGVSSSWCMCNLSWKSRPLTGQAGSRALRQCFRPSVPHPDAYATVGSVGPP